MPREKTRKIVMRSARRLSYGLTRASLRQQERLWLRDLARLFCKYQTWRVVTVPALCELWGVKDWAVEQFLLKMHNMHLVDLRGGHGPRRFGVRFMAGLYPKVGFASDKEGELLRGVFDDAARDEALAARSRRVHREADR